eukprot:gene20758-27578_t
MADLESLVLKSINDGGCIDDTGDFAKQNGADHLATVGIMKSLQASEMITVEDIDHFKWTLSAEGVLYGDIGSPEAQVFNIVPAEGLALSLLKAPASGDEVDSFEDKTQALLKVKMLKVDSIEDKTQALLKAIQDGKDMAKPDAEDLKKLQVVDSIEGKTQALLKVKMLKVDSIEDKTQALLKAIQDGKEVAKPDAEALKKRKLVKPEAWKTYKISKGPKFALERVKPATDLTVDMLAKGTWRTQEFKDYNFNALGTPTTGGHLHPLLK